MKEYLLRELGYVFIELLVVIVLTLEEQSERGNTVIPC